MSAARTINIKLTHNGQTFDVEVPEGADLGHIRSLEEQLENLAVPSSFSLAINYVAQDEGTKLSDGDNVTFRPVAGDKGA